ncbi:beta strand repeat-containing protein [Paractinoplanes atraurantiacus]|uniref:IPT/TIG domain-containing protein n=1 Tax=Paractinoplanes atraurantiacus TaxID=1036182 RepID=A0A285K347_9ACTN|nr:IPT/TIG domain-containing protein [Actinoplanes atraurantiacus]SNY65751.1 IPT/TIG domain-containing protein [Actinoplanes atraurantiacus]
MRKSSTRARHLGAVLTTGAVGAALLTAPTAASAAALTSMTPGAAAPGATITAVATSSTAFSSVDPFVVIIPTSTQTTCESGVAASAAKTGAVTVTAAKVTGVNNSASFVVPSASTLSLTTSPKPYAVCLYGGATSGAATLVDSSPASVLTVVPSLTPGGGASGATVTLKGPTASSFATNLPGIIFTTNSSCPATYATTSPNISASGIQRVDDGTVTFNPPTNAALNSGAARNYEVCAYTLATSAGTLLGDYSQWTFAPTVASSAATGPSGGSNSLTFTSATGTTPFANANAPGVVFTLTGGCPATYGSPGNRAGTSVTKTSSSVISATVPAGVTGTGATTPYNVCFYNGTTSTDALIGVGAATYSVTIPAISLSSTVGPATTTNGITATSTSNFLLGVSTLGANYVTAERCPVTYTAATSGIVEGAAGSVRKLANNRLAATVPSLALVNASPTIYQACFYNGATAGQSTLVGSAAYTVMNPHTVSSVAPTSGSVLGGTDIVVTGTNFPTTAGSITATLGGIPLLNITPVSPNAFTATTPQHAAENGSTLVVTTVSGSKTLANAYSFLNDVVVTPNTAPNTTTGIDLTVKGVGFYSVSFGAGAAAHMYLVNGTYNPTDISGSGTTKANGPVAECGDVLVISDTELICTLALNRRFNAAGTAIDPTTYTNATVTAATTVLGNRVITATAGGFVPQDTGLVVSNATTLAPGTRIARVLSSTTALLDRDPIAAATGATGVLAIGGAVKTTAAAVNTPSSGTTITAPAGTFTSADIGRAITGTGLNTGGVSFITGVGSGGGSATVSLPVAGTQTGQVMVLYAPIAVPNNAYTLTFVTNGSVNANISDPDYSQSVVSSGSTFTVAPA